MSLGNFLRNLVESDLDRGEIDAPKTSWVDQFAPLRATAIQDSLPATSKQAPL
jgi:hypothetical protein